MVGDTFLALTDTGKAINFDKDAIARFYNHEFDVEIENADNFYIEEMFTYGVNYGTNGPDLNSGLAIRFTCNIKGGSTTFSSRLPLDRYILTVLDDITIEDLINGNLNNRELEIFSLNINMTKEQIAWLKLQ
jgi:hypothetical protein